MNLDVLVITPPRSATVQKMISRSYPEFPSTDSVPLRAAQVLEEGGFKVQFLPLFNLFNNFSVEKDADDLSEYIGQYDTDVVLEINDYYIRSRGIPAYPASLYVAHLMKECNPNCHVILAGSHVSALRHSVFLDSQDVDVVIKLEGEAILCDLVKHLQKDGSLEEIKGILYRENGQIRETGGYGIVKELDSLPVPAYHLLRKWAEEIPNRMGRASGFVDLTLRTSYGCPHRCAFCGGTPTWNICRFRSAEKVAEDMEYAKDTLKGKNIRFFYFDDENFNINMDHLTSIGHMMQKQDMRVEGVLAAVPYLTRETAQEISKFSESILVGAENAVDSILATVNKRQTFDQVLRACKTAKEFKLGIDLQWVIGLPGEDAQTIPVNLHAIHRILMKGNARSVSPNLLRPQPGSDIGDHPEKYGIIIHHKNWSEYHTKGSYPSFSSKTLTRSQIYVYYLMAEWIALESSQIGNLYESHNMEPIVWEPDIGLFSRFMEGVGL
ncbi:MAG: hypothetical protein AYK18_15100 [Theionarchaea archaeon DG-70]|nr:MAG: hypothetical protein AYK18_15100 [Theionarchaea archaeon DG-70]